jgi:phosphoserine phosphatase RsbU/P
MQRSGPAIDALSYSACCRQLDELGGDCYDFLPLPDGRLAMGVGDGSGKGPAAALGAVNRQVYASSLADRYATLFYGVFDGATRTLRYVNAGHNPPMVVRQGGSVTLLETGGAPVGCFRIGSNEQDTVQLHPGDLVVAYTDGVTEAVDPAGQEWGVEGLRSAVAESGAKCADGIVRAIFTSMDEFSQGHQIDDANVEFCAYIEPAHQLRSSRSSFSSARLPDNDLKVEQDLAAGQIRSLQPLQHGSNRRGSNIGAGLMHRGERYRQ